MPGRSSNQAWSLPSIWIELAEASAAVARLVDRSGALPARRPQARGGHQRPHGLLAKDQAMALAQLLAGKRGAEVGVAIADRSLSARSAAPGAS